jgi:hypothetical protein
MREGKVKNQYSKNCEKVWTQDGSSSECNKLALPEGLLGLI